jgi:hypothetical protein
MKQVKTLFFVLIAFASICLAFNTDRQISAPQQQEPVINVGMTLQQWQIVGDIIDNSATEGSIRKPLLQLIEVQVNSGVAKLRESARLADSVAKSKPKLDTSRVRNGDGANRQIGTKKN